MMQCSESSFSIYKMLITRFALIVVFSFFQIGIPALSQTVINEVMPIPLTGEPEWVELYNSDTKAVPLDSCFMHDTRTTIRLPRFSIPSGGYALLTRDTFALRETRSLPAKVVLVECKLPSLNNSWDIVVLRSRDSVVIDSIYYNMKWGKRGISLERKRIDTAATSQLNWFASESPDSATAGEVNSITPLRYDARIARIYVPKQEQSVRIILENHGFWSLDTIRFALYADIDGTGVPAQANLIADNTITALKPNDFQEIAVPFSSVKPFWGEAGSAPLIGICTALRDTRRRNDTMRCAIFLPYPIGSIRINEIMFEPATNCSDYVELANTTDMPINLTGWMLHDRPTSTGADTLHFPNDFTIEPHGFAVVSVDSGIFAQFPRLQGNQHLYVANSRTFNLNSGGDIAALLDPNGNIADSLEYNVKWHSSAIRITKGISLEKISPLMPSISQASWSSSGAPSGGTPLETNSIAVEPSETDRFEASPQPFILNGGSANSLCLLSYSLQFRQAQITVSIYTRSGQPVRTLANSVYSAGVGSVAWDGRDESQMLMPTGIYVAVLEAIDAETGEVRQEKTTVIIGN